MSVNPGRRAATPVSLLLACLLLHWYSADAERVEAGYGDRVFPMIGGSLRSLFGAVPFSVGDILYAAFLALLLYRLVRFIVRLRQEKTGRRALWSAALRRAFLFACEVYLVFNLLWGLNYNRPGIAKTLGLKLETYSVTDLRQMNGLLVQRINSCKKSLLQNREPPLTNSRLFSETSEAYAGLAHRFPQLAYSPRSLKSSLFGEIGNYSGFTGYYNPFSGEAQVNTTVPRFTQPFTACHEVAHQIGFAKEMEANFVGYLAAASSTDTLFRYSVYCDLFLYANRTLYYADSASAHQYRQMLDTAVRADFAESRRFALAHRSFMEPVVQYIYTRYLEQNEQPMGLLSYDRVTAFIIAFYKKFGTV